MKWIDANDKPPEPGLPVLVFFSLYGTGCQMVCRFNKKYNAFESEFGVLKMNITHWMPLPQPPV